jgi:hypothetical protein
VASIEAVTSETDLRGLDKQVLAWLSPDDRDPASVSQREAQQLAWYTAPQQWVMPVDELSEVAAACARLLETSGRPRAAAALLEHTPAVLAGWARSPRAGFAAYLRTMPATGVQPPDTPTLAWAQVMGIDEARVLDAAERMLEAALDAGAFTPGRRGWRSIQRNLVDAWLRAPSPLFAGQAPVDVVHAERTVYWAEAGTSTRRTILHPVLPLLAMPTDRATDTVAPVHFLLDAISQGIRLTDTGQLPPAFVRDAAARFGWGLPAFTIRKEGDVVEVGEVRDLATRAGLITVRKRQLVLTAAGWAALGDPARLWSTATAGWFDHDEFATHVAEVAAVLLLAEPGTSMHLTAAAHEAVAPSFQNLEGAQPDRRDVRLALWDWLRPGHALGWLRYQDSRTERIHELTDPGRAAAIEGLRHRSRAPRR